MDVTSLSPAAQEALAYIRQHLRVSLVTDVFRGDVYSRTTSTDVKITVEILLGGEALDSSSDWITILHPE